MNVYRFSYVCFLIGTLQQSQAPHQQICQDELRAGTGWTSIFTSFWSTKDRCLSLLKQTVCTRCFSVNQPQKHPKQGFMLFSFNEGEVAPQGCWWALMMSWTCFYSSSWRLPALHDLGLPTQFDWALRFSPTGNHRHNCAAVQSEPKWKNEWPYKHWGSLQVGRMQW